MNQEKEFTKVQELVYELKVSDAMTLNVITVSPEMLMSELRELLRSNRISGTPVIEGNKLAGIISIEDVIMWLAEGGIDCPIKNKMTTDVKALYADDPLVHAVSRIGQSGFGRFPVIDRQSGRLVGIINKGDITKRLLRELETDSREEKIHRYRTSHIFEDIKADKTILTIKSHVKGKDFNSAGEVSSGLKKTLECLAFHPQVIRRAAIASYEAEMNLVIYAERGEISIEVEPDKIFFDINDTGPGIPDIEKALKPGYSTAPEWVRELGFGAGMGLNNIQKCSDEMNLTSTVGKGTHLKFSIDMKID